MLPTAGPGAAGRTAKGEQRRAQIARAAADLVREQGPAALSHRAVAQRAGVSLSATTYYYGGLDDLAGAAGSGLVDAWVAHAEQVRAGLGSAALAPGAEDAGAGGAGAEGLGAGGAGADGPGAGGAGAEGLGAGAPGVGDVDPAAVLVDALLPPGDDAAVLAHYQLLLDAGRAPALAAALGEGRQRLDAVLADLFAALPCPALDPALVLAVLDGAVVTAVSEARPLRPTARTLLTTLLR